MLYRSVGDTGLSVSEIGFGCASYWGKKIFSENEAIRLVHTAVDRGVNFFDTGASYSDGNAEPRLGRALSDLTNKSDLIVATKAGSRISRGKWHEDFSPSGVRQTVEESLVRLKLDAIPLLQLHGPDIANLTDELLDTLIRLKEEGKVRHLGVNSFDMRVIEHVMTLPEFRVVMIDYNILRPERETMVKRLAAQRLGILAGMALGGVLFRKFTVGGGFRSAWYLARAWKNHRADFSRAKSFRFLNDEPGQSSGAIALSWALRNPAISSAFFGTTRMSHLLDNLDSSGRILSDDLVRKIADAQSSFSR
jgi:aryl-alcohol dehydrogenase-like predicted oxidoreductase